MRALANRCMAWRMWRRQKPIPRRYGSLERYQYDRAIWMENKP